MSPPPPATEPASELVEVRTLHTWIAQRLDEIDAKTAKLNLTSGGAAAASVGAAAIVGSIMFPGIGLVLGSVAAALAGGLFAKGQTQQQRVEVLRDRLARIDAPLRTGAISGEDAITQLRSLRTEIATEWPEL